MKIKKNVLVILTMLFFISSITLVSALSVGISPSEKSVTLEENKGSTVYFAVSQGSKESENIAISTDADWLKAEEENFDLESMGQKYVKFTISPLPAGDYKAKIKVSTSIGAMSSSVTANVILSVQPTAKIPESEETARNEAWTSITNAQSATQKLRSITTNTTIPDDILTKAMEEFDKENYNYAKNYANYAYSIATEEYDRINRDESLVMFLTLMIVIESVEILVVLIYEIVRIKRSKKKISPGIKCPKCGATTDMTFDGNLLTYYKCPKCNHEEANFKSLELKK